MSSLGGNKDPIAHLRFHDGLPLVETVTRSLDDLMEAPFEERLEKVRAKYRTGFKVVEVDAGGTVYFYASPVE